MCSYGVGWGVQWLGETETDKVAKKGVAEKDGDKEEETEREEGALNGLCSPSSSLSLFHHKVDEGSLHCLSSVIVFSRSNT